MDPRGASAAFGVFTPKGARMNGYVTATLAALGGVLLVAGALLDRSAVALGLMAATIAVGGFVGRARELLRGGDEEAVQRGTVVGGLFGLAGAVMIIVIDVVAG